MNEESCTELRELLDYSNFLYTESTGASNLSYKDVRRNQKKESTGGQPSDKYDKYNNRIIGKESISEIK